MKVSFYRTYYRDKWFRTLRTEHYVVIYLGYRRLLVEW